MTKRAEGDFFRFKPWTLVGGHCDSLTMSCVAFALCMTITGAVLVRWYDYTVTSVAKVYRDRVLYYGSIWTTCVTRETAMEECRPIEPVPEWILVTRMMLILGVALNFLSVAQWVSLVVVSYVYDLIDYIQTVVLARAIITVTSLMSGLFLLVATIIFGALVVKPERRAELLYVWKDNERVMEQVASSDNNEYLNYGFCFYTVVLGCLLTTTSALLTHLCRRKEIHEEY